MKRKIWVIFFFVWFIALLVVFISSAYSLDLYLNYGECYEVNSNLSVCSAECHQSILNYTVNNVTLIKENITTVIEFPYNISYNFTCPEYNFTDIVNDMDGVNAIVVNSSKDLIEVSDNFANDIYPILGTFNLTDENQVLYHDWKSCEEDILVARNETESLRYLEEDLAECGTYLSSSTQNISVMSANLVRAKTDRTRDSAILFIVGLGVGYFLWHRSPPRKSGLSGTKSSGPPMNRSALQKLTDRIKGEEIE